MLNHLPAGRIDPQHAELGQPDERGPAAADLGLALRASQSRARTAAGAAAVTTVSTTHGLWNIACFVSGVQVPKLYHAPATANQTRPPCKVSRRNPWPRCDRPRSRALQTRPSRRRSRRRWSSGPVRTSRASGARAADRRRSSAVPSAAPWKLCCCQRSGQAFRFSIRLMALAKMKPIAMNKHRREPAGGSLPTGHSLALRRPARRRRGRRRSRPARGARSPRTRTRP